MLRAAAILVSCLCGAKDNFPHACNHGRACNITAATVFFIHSSNYLDFFRVRMAFKGQLIRIFDILPTHSAVFGIAFHFFRRAFIVVALFLVPGNSFTKNNLVTQFLMVLMARPQN
jgi:hypothetical protein